MRKRDVAVLVSVILSACLAASIFLTAIAAHIYQSWIPFLSLGCIFMAVLIPTLCTSPNYDPTFGDPFGDAAFQEEATLVGWFLFAVFLTSAFFGPIDLVIGGLAPVNMIWFTALSSLCGGAVLVVIMQVINAPEGSIV